MTIHAPIRATATTLALAGVLAFAGCAATPDEPDPTLTPSTSPSSDTSGAPSGLQEMLARIPANAAEPSPYVEYGDLAKLRAFAAEDEEWADFPGFGFSGLAGQAPVMTDDYAINLDDVSVALTVGTMPSALTVLVGPQDAAAVQAAFEGAGWADEEGVLVTGDGVPLTVPLALQAPQVLVEDDILALAGANVDAAALRSEIAVSAMDDELTARLATCLGDPIAAMVDPETGVAAALSDAGEARVCYDAGVTDAATVESGWTERPAELTDRFGDAVVAEGDGVISVDLPVLQGPFTVFQALMQRQLPGLP